MNIWPSEPPFHPLDRAFRLAAMVLLAAAPWAWFVVVAVVGIAGP